MIFCWMCSNHSEIRDFGFLEEFERRKIIGFAFALKQSNEAVNVSRNKRAHGPSVAHFLFCSQSIPNGKCAVAKCLILPPTLLYLFRRHHCKRRARACARLL